MQNTRQMSLDPAPADDFAQLDPNNCAGVELLPVFSGVAFLAAVAYPVLVEMWEKKKSGRVKRAWLATFTEAERELRCDNHLARPPPVEYSLFVHSS